MIVATMDGVFSQSFEVLFQVVTPTDAQISFAAPIFYIDLPDPATLPATLTAVFSNASTASLSPILTPSRLSSRVTFNTGNENFAIDADGKLVVLGTPWLQNSTTAITLQITARVVGYPSLNAQAQIVVSILRTPLGPPVFTTPTYNFSITGNLNAGDTVGRVLASDRLGVSVSYTLAAAAAAQVFLRSDTGLVVALGFINASLVPQLSFTVIATNGVFNASATVVVTLSPIDLCAGVVCAAKACYQPGECVLGTCVYTTRLSGAVLGSACDTSLCNCSGGDVSGIMW